MFNAFFAEEAGHKANKMDDEEADSGEASTSTTAPVNPLLNLWSVATAVTNTVKARADELVKSVVDTDWKSELSTFSREVGEESKTLKDKTAELVEHLPEQVGHLPEKAEEALHQLPGQVQLPKDVNQTLEGVGVALSEFGKSLFQGTRELIDELRDGVDTEIAVASREGKRAARNKPASASAGKVSAVQAKYSRFDAEVAAMQRDSSTYCDEPEDTEEYARWKAGWSLEGVKSDIARITADNAFMSELQSRLVPIIVEQDDFWGRYFYRLHKLQQKEEQRQQLAQRAKTLQEDEVPLGWGDEDEAPPASSIGAAAQRTGGDGASTSKEAAAAAPTPTSAATEPKPAGRGSRAKPKAAEVSEMPVPLPLSAAAEEAAPTPESSPAESASPAEEEVAEIEASARLVAELEAVPGTLGERSPDKASEGRGGSAGQSGGGDSAGTAEHVDADAGQMESEPHAETASDSSTKEWCVVTSDTKASASASAAAAGMASTADAAPESSGAAGPNVKPEASPSHTAPTEAGSEEGVEEEQEEEQEEKKPLSGTTAAATSTPSKTAGAAQPGGARPAGGPGRAGGKEDEEVDEDWGNWD